MREPLVRGPAGFGDDRHGFEPVPLPGDIEAFGHGGDSIYQVADMTLVPSLGLGVFVSSNTSSGRHLALLLRQALVSDLTGAVLRPPVYGPNAYAEARSYAGDYRDLRRAYFRTERGIYGLLIAPGRMTAAPNGDLHLTSLVQNPHWFVPLGHGVYREKDGPSRIAFRPMAGRMAIYDPYAAKAWEPIGYFDTPAWILLACGLTLAMAVAVLIGAIRRAFGRRRDSGLEAYASAMLAAGAVAWLAGFAAFGAVLAKAFSSPVPEELMWWYPPQALVWSCWLFAAGAVLALAATPGLAVVGRRNGWSVWRKGVHAVELAIFLACALTLWRLGFTGFSGW
jgi:hypothetical protein